MDGTTVLSDDGISVTTRYSRCNQVNYHFASLTRQVTGEKIELGKTIVLLLGKNPEKSDHA